MAFKRSAVRIPNRRVQTDSYMRLFRSGENDNPPIIRYKYHESRAEGMQLLRKGSRPAKAIKYMKNRRNFMMTYLEDGHCSLSNNLSKQEMKAFVIGRKNWLFGNSTKEADALAICYSLCEMAKANGINIYKYLEFLLKVKTSENMSQAELENYLPWSK